MVGLDTPRSRVASPTVVAPPLSRATMSRRVGWASAVNGSLANLLTIYRAGRCQMAQSVVRFGRRRKASPDSDAGAKRRQIWTLSDHI